MLITNGSLCDRSWGKIALLYFHHLSPISVGEREEAGGTMMVMTIEMTKQPIQNKSLLPKESSGALSESQIRTTVTAKHLVALTFDNIEFLWQRLEESALADTIRVISLTPLENISVVVYQSVSSDSDHAESN